MLKSEVMLLACCLRINSRCGLCLMNQYAVFPYCSFIWCWQTLSGGSSGAVDCHGGKDLAIPNGRMVGVGGLSVDLCCLNVHSGGFKSSGLIYFWDKAGASDCPFRSSVTQAAQP